MNRLFETEEKTDTLPKGLNVLVVDDDPNVLTSYRIALHSIGVNKAITCSNGREVPEILERERIDLVVLDLIMPEIGGEELLTQIVESHPDVAVIITTGVNEIKVAVRCMRSGAFDYLVKPVDVDRLEHSIHRLVDLKMLHRENEKLTSQLLTSKLNVPEAFRPVITRSKSMFSIFQYCEAIADSHFPVLVTGETGVGKEMIARAIHDVSHKSGRFHAVNLAGLDDQMVNDTLFGHAKGGFTGAITDRKGLIENAAGGSLFLDEIGDLSLQSQVKLLRLLQEREYYPIGSDAPKTTDTRFILATHADIEKMLEKGDFRQDLFFRLRTHHIRIPPLRERREDIQLLFDYFLEIAAKDLKKKVPHYPKQLLNLLELYSFPGNVRELQSLVYEAVSRHSSRTLSTVVFKERIRSNQLAKQDKPVTRKEQNWLAELDELPTLQESNRLLIEEAMRRAGNNQRAAAELLGISHQALNKRLKKLNGAWAG